MAFDAPGKAWAKRARTALLGVDFSGLEAIFTPLAPVYRRLVTLIDSTTHDGWWSASTDDDVLVAHVPQGSPMLDGVYALRPGTRITFVGLAGSLRGLPVGSVVEPWTGSVIWPGCHILDGAGAAVAARSHPATLIGAPGHVVSVGCLAQSTQQHAQLARYADYIDLETGPVLGVAATCGHPARSVLVISDSNDQGDVFGSDPADTRDVLDRVCREVISTSTRRRAASV